MDRTETVESASRGINGWLGTPLHEYRGTEPRTFNCRQLTDETITSAMFSGRVAEIGLTNGRDLQSRE